MGAVSRDAQYLLAQARELCRCSPHGFRPWRGDELLRVIERATRRESDHGAFYVEFMEGIRDLAESEEEDDILRRFADQTLAVEARVHADNRGARDHLTHVTQVFLCGWLILNGCRRFAFAPEDWRPYDWPSATEERFELLNRAWLFTSLLHDCAYSVQEARHARRHEASVKGLFGAVYRGGDAGGVDAEELSKQALVLWRKRRRWIMPDEAGPAGPPKGALSTLQDQYKRGDHAIVGSVALHNAIGLLHRQALAAVLEPAAVAIACHNNQYLVDVTEESDSEANRWFRLDLWQEPLGALLHLCDEIQEWSRERADAALGRREGRQVCRYEATEVTLLEVSDSVGLAVEARLLRRLHPEDRPARFRLVREQERSIAETGRRFRLLFSPRTLRPEFQLHLRLEQTVDDLRCGNALTVSWPDPARGQLQSLHKQWLDDQEMRSAGSRRLEQVLLTVEAGVSPPTAAADIVFDGNDARMIVQPGPATSLRAAIIAPGGAGKSTFLQALARIHFIGRVPAHPLYVEQLPDRPSDLDEEVFRLHESHPDRAILLLVDHLDRLDEDEYGQFWLEQLAVLRRAPWLHVILASRPEEFDRSLGAALFDRYARCELQGPRAPFVGGDTDAEGRARASAIERGMKGSPHADVRRLAALAFGMGPRRRTALPMGTVVSDHGGKYRGTSVLVECPDGTYRFAHDAIQDYLTALHLASELAEKPTDTDAVRACVRSFARLPRDVPRLLFDMLAADGWLMTASCRKRSAEALARGLLRDKTTEYWLHDTGRIEQARLAIEEFQRRHADDRRACMAGHLLAGMAAYRRHRVADLADRVRRESALEDARRCIVSIVESAREAEHLLQEDEPKRDDRHDQLHIAVIADHIVSMLAGLTKHDPRGLEAQRLARHAVERLASHRDAAALAPGWLAGLLGSIEHGASYDELVGLLERVYSETEKLVLAERNNPARDAESGEQLAWLDTHLGATAGHLCTAWTERSDRDPKPVDDFKIAMRWHLRCLMQTERMARWTRTEERPYPYLGFLDLAQAYSHVAWQKSTGFKIHLYSAASSRRNRESVARVIEAHTAQEAAWNLAKHALAPGNRLCYWYRHALPMLVAGSALRALVEDANKAVSEEPAKEVLNREGTARFKEYQRIGEPHPRFRGKDDSVEALITHFRGALGDVPTLLADLAKTMRG